MCARAGACMMSGGVSVCECVRERVFVSVYVCARGCVQNEYV